MLFSGKIKRPNPICAGEENPTEHILYEIWGIRMAIIGGNHQQGLNW